MFELFALALLQFSTLFGTPDATLNRANPQQEYNSPQAGSTNNTDTDTGGAGWGDGHFTENGTGGAGWGDGH